MSYFTKCIPCHIVFAISFLAALNRICAELKLDWREIEVQTEESLAKLPDESPLLATVYEQFILSMPESPWPGWYHAASVDLEKRGNRATPVLLRLFKDNAEGAFQAQLFSKIGGYDSIDMPPYLETARTLFEREGLNLPPRTCYGLALFLSLRGSASDLKILDKLKTHPNAEVELVVSPIFRKMQKRIGNSDGDKSRPEASVSLKNPPQAKQPNAQKPPMQTAVVPQSESKSWLVWLFVVVAAIIGVAWLLLRKRN